MLCALGAAVCFGTATVLQAMAARSVAATGPVGDVALLWRALRQWRYLVGLALDGLGFLLQIIALRSVPIYAVGAALAASLAVTAVVAARLLKVRLSRMEWAAVGVVCAGLALLGLASGAEGDESGPGWLKWAMLGAAAGVLLLGAVGGRLPERGRALALGLGAGCGFGVVEVAVRLIDGLSPGELFTNPAAYALVLGGGAAFLLLTSALQRGSVTTATAGLVLGETVAPALIGVIWLGDRTREGLGWLAVLGFAVAVAGALALSRFGEAPVEAEGGAAGEAGEDAVAPK
ncbi:MULTISPECIES: DMT family transporter [Streptomyces]|uniref:DMT family transporter n=1 Tax=Streptomyces koelreuteriae TaxID=2838015 RepID=A0ABX8G4E5_9ACTN|nr:MULTISPECIES: DMT family transporter [Streptomyces]QWB28231.1 DMT family transporter [Streptomyces koelreuteriae]UUA11312.1 DMT family transporter [Streptomyces koelreuteriae]UUA18912.1 DMT family transporter [Streptomyces sp. CRCS-T-1]